MLCWQPLGRPVVPLVYIRNSGASAGMDTGATVWPAYWPIRSSTWKSRPSAIGTADAYWPACRRKTSTLSTSWPCRFASATASSALTLWSSRSPLR